MGIGKTMSNDIIRLERRFASLLSVQFIWPVIIISYMQNVGIVRCELVNTALVLPFQIQPFFHAFGLVHSFGVGERSMPLFEFKQ